MIAIISMVQAYLNLAKSNLIRTEEMIAIISMVQAYLNLAKSNLIRTYAKPSFVGWAVPTLR
ncbi:hypothetical protein C7B76_25050 [filamentous cyanobacterium CCP2]|nr:hypothetical protein C7B76_25050 [filamentous cyanobacterium CCP2]